MPCADERMNKWPELANGERSPWTKKKVMFARAGVGDVGAASGQAPNWHNTESTGLNAGRSVVPAEIGNQPDKRQHFALHRPVPAVEAGAASGNEIGV